MVRSKINSMKAMRAGINVQQKRRYTIPNPI
jgi:hypothetical protein